MRVFAHKNNRHTKTNKHAYIHTYIMLKKRWRIRSLMLTKVPSLEEFAVS